MQKLDAGAILVNGKEELPLGYPDGDGHDNATNLKILPETDRRKTRDDEQRGIPIPDENLDPDESPFTRRRRPRRPRRYLSDDELIGVHPGKKIVQSEINVTEADGVLLTNGINGTGDSLNCGGKETVLLSNNDNRPQHPRLVDGTRDRNANARISRSNTYENGQRQSATLPRRRRRRAMSGSIIGNPLPPHRVTPDGTAIYYWCELPRRPGSQGKFIPVINTEKKTEKR